MAADSTTKRKTGRPAAEPKAPHRPVIACRAPVDVYEKIAAAARISGRTMSEEMAWRVLQAFAWEAAHGDIQALRAKVEHVNAETTHKALEAELVRRGYTKVRGINGYAWFQPGVNAINFIDPQIVEELKAYIAARGRKS